MIRRRMVALATAMTLTCGGVAVAPAASAQTESSSEVLNNSSTDANGQPASTVVDGEGSSAWFDRQSTSMKALVVIGVFLALTSALPFVFGILRTVVYNVAGR